MSKSKGARWGGRGNRRAMPRSAKRMKTVMRDCATPEEVAAAPDFSRLTVEQEAHLDRELGKIFGSNTSYGKRRSEAKRKKEQQR